MESLIELEPFRSIADDLEEFISQHSVIGYHCTKEPESGYFEMSGLRVLDRQRQQTEFLERFGHRFSEEELSQIQQDWNAFFPGQQDGCRNGTLWFCLAPDQVIDSGTERFFTYFGGEAVYAPITQRPSIEEKLRAIGNPVVVEVSIAPRELQTFSRVPFAINALSLFHRRLNPEAFVHGREGYLKRSVEPSEIIRVRPQPSFFAAYAKCLSHERL
ncbi:MAG: hypothetical protein NUV85_00935 [Candidatus Berkelbacteria bacterium]|nr:hypothetical protein [Candidatus Berkelbacteria bacterium]